MTFGQTLIITIISSSVTGLLAILGVVLTLRQNNKQLQLQIEERAEEKRQKIIDERPEFEIVDMKRNFTERGYEPDDSFDIDCMVTLYEGTYTKKDFESKLVSAEYTLKNVGKAKVEFLDLCFYNNQIELLDMKNCDIDTFIRNPKAFPTTTYIRYAGMKVHHNQEIKVRIWYRSNNVPVKFISYQSFIGFMAFNKKYWKQNFDTPSDGIEDSTLLGETEYYHLIHRKDQWGK